MDIEELKQKLSELKAGTGTKKEELSEEYETEEVQIEETGGEGHDENASRIAGNKIKNILKRKIRLQDSFLKGHRSGRVDLDSIRKQIAKTGRVTANNVFERTKSSDSRGGKWACSILIDASGSMAGMFLQQAKTVLASFASAFDS